MVALTFTVNGKGHTVHIDPAETLMDVLRDRLLLTGTKDGCREGECGSCTVIVDGRPVSSCIYAAKAAEGREVETIEGLNGEALGGIQQAMIEAGAVQCGYCTPGFVMMLTALLREHPKPDVGMIEEALNGNICRCTGYAQIVDAVMKVTGGQEEASP
jgi:carbon-monoxide dehydrogenase small subunit